MTMNTTLLFSVSLLFSTSAATPRGHSAVHVQDTRRGSSIAHVPGLTADF